MPKQLTLLFVLSFRFGEFYLILAKHEIQAARIDCGLLLCKLVDFFPCYV